MASGLSGNGGAKDGGKDQEDIRRGLRERAGSSGSMPTPTATPLLVQLKGVWLSRKNCHSNFACPSPASDSSFSGAGGGGASVSPCAASAREMENSSRPNAVSKPPDTLSRPSPGPSGPGEAPKAASAGRASPSGIGNKQSSVTTPAKRKRKRKSNRPETTTIMAASPEDFKVKVQEKTGVQNGMALASCSTPPRLQALDFKDIAASSTAGSNRPAATLTATASNPPPPAKELTFSAPPPRTPCYGGVDDSELALPCQNLNEVMGFGDSMPYFFQDSDPDMDHNAGKSASELLRPAEHPLSSPYADRTSKPRWPQDIRDIPEGYLSPERSHASAGGGWAPAPCYEEDIPYNLHTLQLVDDPRTMHMVDGWLMFPSLDSPERS